MPFALEEYRHWKPLPPIMDWLTNRVIKPLDRVLDVGCGCAPFPRADVSIDRYARENLEKLWDDCKVEHRPKKLVQHDFSHAPMPFKEKEFDFVYCRHTLEDMLDPFLLMGDMQRVGKAGYIETPSPFSELSRGIDGFKNSYLWRGYYHHRFFVWVRDGELCFVSKYPIVEHFDYMDNEKTLEDLLRKRPELWNTYFLWTDEIRWKHLEDPFDFKVYQDYQTLLWQAAVDSAKSTDALCHRILDDVGQQAA